MDSELGECVRGLVHTAINLIRRLAMKFRTLLGIAILAYVLFLSGQSNAQSSHHAHQDNACNDKLTDVLLY